MEYDRIGTWGSLEDSVMNIEGRGVYQTSSHSYPAPPVTPVARPDAHPAHSGGLYLQLVGRGAAPPGDRWPEDRSGFMHPLGPLLVPFAAG